MLPAPPAVGVVQIAVTDRRLAGPMVVGGQPGLEAAAEAGGIVAAEGVGDNMLRRLLLAGIAVVAGTAVVGHIGLFLGEEDNSHPAVAEVVECCIQTFCLRFFFFFLFVCLDRKTRSY